MWEGPEALRLAGELAGVEGVSSVALYKGEGGDFPCSLRCEFADVMGDKSDQFTRIDEAFSKVRGSGGGPEGVQRGSKGDPKGVQRGSRYGFGCVLHCWRVAGEPNMASVVY
eukprot:244756-Prorocentrum_minimum.AAC.1